jgi:hypothetical protein
MRTPAEGPHRLGPALVLLTLLVSPTATHTQPFSLESYRQTFYPGLTVTSQHMASGELVASVQGFEADRLVTRATFRLRPVLGVGEWTVSPNASDPGDLRVYAYGGDPSFDGAALARRHTARSMALSALLLWEEHVAERTGLAERYGDRCPSCRPSENGCSGWFETCNGQPVTDLCHRHDVCYQCGSTCESTSRAQCDAQFRAEVRARTGSTWCGLIYWLGVRGLGWLFYQDPSQRIDMQPDLYSLGVALSACPTSYYHLCTIYVF